MTLPKLEPAALMETLRLAVQRWTDGDFVKPRVKFISGQPFVIMRFEEMAAMVACCDAYIDIMDEAKNEKAN